MSKNCHKRNKRKATSEVIPFNTGIKKKQRVDIEPRSINQEEFLDHLNDDTKHICFGIGPAGSGKTLIATLMSIKMLKENKISKIVISRPNVAVDDRDIGFLPGTIYDKMLPWIRPITDVFEEYFTPAEIATMMEENIIEICPVAYLRGRTFKNTWVLVDEAQGLTPNAMKSVLTRIGEGSKMVVTGDTRQTDLKETSGLKDFLDRYSHSNSISLTEFEVKDVVRHPVVKEILRLYKEDD